MRKSSLKLYSLSGSSPTVISMKKSAHPAKTKYSPDRNFRISLPSGPLLVILPAAAPTILTGMRISIGIAWLVIVAAEMLVGGTGIGYYVWNEWNNLDLTSVIFSILMIGFVGMMLDIILGSATRLVAYNE